MKIFIEAPIENKGEDKLNRKNFTENIADKINKYEEKEMFTIGIHGEWGSGKSSIINMLKEDIDEKRYKVVEFNPWHFSSRKQLITDFFEHLSVSLELNNNSSELVEIGKNMKIYSQLLKAATYIPPLAVLSPIAEGTKYISKALESYSKGQSMNLTQLKGKIDKALQNCSKKILIIIDEIDRLENSEVKEIFQLVRALGDFNNIVYILSYDEKKVKKIFESGEDYLEKIITIPISVPAISPQKLNSLFRKELNRIFSGKITIDSNYWKKVFPLVFENNFKNLREMNRYLNTVKINSGAILSELNIVDYLIVSFFQQFDVEFYEFIKENKDKLLRGSEKEWKEILENLKNKITESKNRDNNERILKILFKKDENSKRDRRVCTYKYFDSYFECYLKGALSRKTLEEILDFNSYEDLIEKINLVGDLELLFDHLDELYLKLEENKRYICLEAFLVKAKQLKEDEENLFGESSQEKGFASLKKLTKDLPDLEKIIGIIKSNKLSNEYEVEPLIDYYSFIYSKSSEAQRKVLRKQISEYILQVPYNKETFKEFKKIKKMKIDLSDYIKKITETDQGFINYLKTLIEVKELHEVPLEVDDEGNVWESELVEEKAIVLENITDYIDYNYLKLRRKELKNDILEINKDVINLFENSKKYEVVYADQIAREKWEEMNREDQFI